MIRAFLYDAQGNDSEIALPADSLPNLEDHQLLWIDMVGLESAEVDHLARVLELEPQSVADITRGARTFRVANYGHYVHFDVAAISAEAPRPGSAPKLARSIRLDMGIGAGWLFTAHEQPLDFLEEFRDQDRGETLIGGLTPAALAASLLDWHLTAYLTALHDLESFADRTELRMLSASTVRDGVLEDLLGARRYVASLRRSLAPQSAVFYGLSRPDIVLIADSNVGGAVEQLGRRFERVLDSIEHGRDIVQSSFDLFAARTAETTNTLLRRLTFISILLGGLTGVAGVFGMNFETPYAKTGLLGFWCVIGGFSLFGSVVALVARARRWI